MVTYSNIKYGTGDVFKYRKWNWLLNQMSNTEELLIQMTNKELVTYSNMD